MVLEADRCLLASLPTTEYGPPAGISFDRFVRACVSIKWLTEAFQRYLRPLFLSLRDQLIFGQTRHGQRRLGVSQLRGLYESKFFVFGTCTVSNCDVDLLRGPLNMITL